MRIDSNLEMAFASAARAEAIRKEQARRAEQERARRAAADMRRHERACVAAPEAATAAWAWLTGPEAEALRGHLREASLPRVMILGWLTDRGQRFDHAWFGRWSVSLLADEVALRVQRLGALASGRLRVARNPDELLDAAAPAPEVVVALAAALHSGRYLRTVRAELRERGRPEALPITRIRMQP